MLKRSITYTTFLLFCVLFSQKVDAQTDHWYLFKSIAPLNSFEVKSLISGVMSETDITKMWYNGDKSSTFGVVTETETDWVQVLHLLQSHGYFLADISAGQVHSEGDEASTSFFYQEANYCSTHADSCPEDYYAKLNQSEWDALPVEAKNFYQETGNYIISE